MRPGVPPDRSPRAGVRQWALWFGVLAPMTAWFAHLVVSYSLVRIVCRAGHPWILHITAVAMLALAVAGVAAAWWSWRRLRSVEERGRPSEGFAGFLALAGLGLGGTFVLAILFQIAPSFLAEPCL